MRTTNKQQRSLATMTGFERYTKKTRRETFLEEMEQVVPWRELCALIEPHYPKPGNGRPPVRSAPRRGAVPANSFLLRPLAP
jgi:hypothetical protein